MRRLLEGDLPIHLTLANLAGFALTFLAVQVIAREIGPIGRGETAAALSAFAIAPTLLGLGIPLELRRRAAQRDAAESVRAARDLILLSIPIATAIGFGFNASVFATADPALKLAGLVGLAVVPLSVSWAADAGVLAGQGRFRAIAAIRVTHPGITLILIAASAYLGILTAPIVLWSSVLATLCTAAVGWALVRIGIFGPRANHVALSKDSLRFAGSSIAESASSRLDQILVLPLIGAAAAGQYSIAASVALLPLALGQTLAANHFRVVASISLIEDKKPAIKLAIRESVAVIIPAVVVFGLVSAPLIPVVFGVDFRDSVPVFLLLLPGSMCLTIGYVASMLLAAQGRGMIMTVLQVITLLVGTVLLLTLAPIWGAIGAGLASTFSYLVLLVGQIIALRLRAWDVVPRTRYLISGVRSLWRR